MFIVFYHVINNTGLSASDERRRDAVVSASDLRQRDAVVSASY